jgi:hypothetical protein
LKTLPSPLTIESPVTPSENAQPTSALTSTRSSCANAGAAHFANDIGIGPGAAVVKEAEDLGEVAGAERDAAFEEWRFPGVRIGPRDFVDLSGHAVDGSRRASDLSHC